MTYEEAVAELNAVLRFGMHPSLDGIRALVGALGSPQDAFASVQVTGTNGKTSVTRLVAALLSAHGLRSASFTSPDLGRYNDRFEIDGVPVSDEGLARSIQAALEAACAVKASGHAESFTEFELLTAAALWLFRSSAVDFAVLEVGMGGRWDATSVVAPTVSVVTGVSLDHTQHLGGTRELIAADKAHIIKPASAPVLGPGTVGVERVFLERVEAVGGHARAVRATGEPSPVAEELTVRFGPAAAIQSASSGIAFDVEGVHGRYPGLVLDAPAYQAANAATAIAAAEAALGRALDPQIVCGALRRMRFPARFETVSTEPLVIVDGSHNPEAAGVLADAVRERFGDVPAVRVLLGVLADKDAEGIVRALAPVVGEWSVTAPGSPRALDAEGLAAVVESVTGRRPRVFADVSSGLAGLVIRGGDPLVVTGSLVTAGEARRLLLGRPAPR